MITSWEIGQIPGVQPGSSAIVEQPNGQADTTTISASGNSSAMSDTGAGSAGTSDRGASERGLSDRSAQDTLSENRPSDARADSVVIAQFADSASAADATTASAGRAVTDSIDRFADTLRELSNAAQNAGGRPEAGTPAANDVGELPV